MAALPDRDPLSSELAVQAARLVRLIRRSHAPSAGPRVLSILDELGPQTVTALAVAVLRAVLEPTEGSS